MTRYCLALYSTPLQSFSLYRKDKLYIIIDQSVLDSIGFKTAFIKQLNSYISERYNKPDETFQEFAMEELLQPKWRKPRLDRRHRCQYYNLPVGSELDQEVYIIVKHPDISRLTPGSNGRYGCPEPNYNWRFARTGQLNTHVMISHLHFSYNPFNLPCDICNKNYRNIIDMSNIKGAYTLTY